MNKRRLVFDGAHNVRDLGGYPTRSGGHVRWRRAYRADGLQDLSDRDIERFRSLGIATVFDLRSDVERQLRPNRVESVPWCVMTPVEDAGAAPVDRERLRDRAAGENHLRNIYANLLEHSSQMFAGIIHEMARPGGTPILFHCHAGKDRTGVMAALLLEMLGVPRDVVLDDYELTATFRTRELQTDSYENLISSGMGIAAAVGVLGAPRWAMAEMLDQLDSDYGGIDRYLAEVGGLERQTIEQLRHQLVER